MKNADNPAMPTLTYDNGAAMQGLAVSVTDAPGLTKREMMAMHIMSGYVANSKAGEAGELMCMHDVASYSVGCADALLAELEKSQ